WERLEHRVPNLFRENARQIVEIFHLLELGVAPSQLDNRFTADLFIEVAQNQCAMLAMVHVWRTRGNRASTQFKVQAEIADDFLRKQTHEIGISGELRVKIGKHALRGGRSADVIIFLQQQDAQSSAPQ